MLEGVTLAQVVQFVVEVLVDLTGRTVLDEETAEDAETAHPEDLAGHARILGTLPFTEAGVAAGTLGVGEDSGTAAGVHGDGFLDDEAISDELADSLAWGIEC